MIAPVNLLLIAGLAGVLSLCVLGSLARSGMAGIKEAIRANLLTLLAFFTFGLQTTSAPWWLSIVVPNSAIALALYSYYSGVRRLMGLGVPRHLMTLGCLATLMVLLIYTYVDWRVGPRIIAMSLLQMGFLLAVAVTVQRNMPAHRSRYSYRFVWAVAVVSAAVCAIRAGAHILDLVPPQALMEPSVWNIAYLTLGVLVMPCLTLGTIMIIHDRMLADREHASDAALNDPFVFPARMATPTIAAVNGFAYAAGFILPLNCDFRVCSENASFAAPGARIGLLPIGGQLSRLPQLMPWAIAHELLVTCREMKADEAHRFGFVSHITPVGGSLDAALKLADQIAANSSDVIASIKHGLNVLAQEGSAAAVEYEWREGGRLQNGPHAEEGMRAFLEKRKPIFA